ncbi:MAG: phosphatidate cytidylyltransferase [Deltaproteobacteria bacterium]|nr:phosphatidate cytidylyltransferase [Deltaproteobacteria bacterium]
MSNLVSRVLTAVVAIPLLAALILWDQRVGFGVLVILCAGLGMSEYTAMMLPDIGRGQRAVIVATGTGLTIALYFRPDLALVWFLAAVIVAATLVLLQPGEITGAGARAGLVVLGLFYVGGLTAPLGLLHRQLADGPLWVLTALAATFANDTGAYFAGRALGRHKLYPAISPAKTVEGAVGGMVFCVAVLLVVRATFFPALTVTDCLLVALPASVLGPIGDLVESMLKRSAGVKDSSHLIPGHGGILDRLDAVLFVGAWVYVYAGFLRG